MQLTILDNEWVHVHGLYDLKKGGICRPGRQGTYGLESEDGRPRYCLTGKNTDGRPTVVKGHEFGMVYPSRLFVTGVDDIGKDSTYEQMLEMLGYLGIQHGKGFWNCCELFHGYRAGTPSFRPALIAHTDIGVRMYSVDQALAKPKDAPNNSWWELPNGCQVTRMRGGTYELWLEDADKKPTKPPEQSKLERELEKVADEARYQ